MARVFVSHASEDHLVAAQLHQWLVDDGHDVFLDQISATVSPSVRSGSSAYMSACVGPTPWSV